MSNWQQFLDHKAFMFVSGDRYTMHFREAYGALERGEPVTIILFNQQMLSAPATQEEFNDAFIAAFDLVFGGEVEHESDMQECDNDSCKMFRIRNDGNSVYYVGLPEPVITE